MRCATQQDGYRQSKTIIGIISQFNYRNPTLMKSLRLEPSSNAESSKRGCLNFKTKQKWLQLINYT